MTGVITALIAFLIGLDALADAISIGTLCAFSVVDAGIIVQRYGVDVTAIVCWEGKLSSLRQKHQSALLWLLMWFAAVRTSTTPAVSSSLWDCSRYQRSSPRWRSTWYATGSIVVAGLTPIPRHSQQCLRRVVAAA